MDILLENPFRGELSNRPEPLVLGHVGIWGGRHGSICRLARATCLSNGMRGYAVAVKLLAITMGTFVLANAACSSRPTAGIRSSPSPASESQASPDTSDVGQSSLGFVENELARLGIRCYRQGPTTFCTDAKSRLILIASKATQVETDGFVKDACTSRQDDGVLLVPITPGWVGSVGERSRDEVVRNPPDPVIQAIRAALEVEIIDC